MATLGPRRLTASGMGFDPVGRMLVRQGAITTRTLLQIEADSLRTDVPVGDIAILEHGVPALDVARARSDAHQTRCVDPMEEAPDPRLISHLGPGRCAALGVLPWRRIGGQVIILTAAPEMLPRIHDELSRAFGSYAVSVATRPAIEAALVRFSGPALAAAAEERVPEHLSSRRWSQTIAIICTGLVLAAGGISLWLAPATTLIVLTLWAVLTLILSTGLKAIAFYHFLRSDRQPHPPAAEPLRQPVVSLLVPLYKERAIAAHLLRRLQAIKYPRKLLDIVLITESDDKVTRSTLAATDLPPWIRTLIVPPGTIKTKPRALNFALDFARGSIVGVYDAEDAPDPDQINRVVARFAATAPDVACLQGILDYYNHRSNWLSRCFTLEYATWFRVLLPGLQRMGLVIPLGGTTLFFRRDVLDRLGGWDAHNVTEDADLGIRLARAGYRTELIETVTEEEANCRPWAWIKQRSRWLKGYAITYGVHMRRPGQLVRDLGIRRFLGLQILFAGTLSQFVLAPLLWSYWAFPLGLPHPLRDVLGTPALITLGAAFLCAEVLNIVVAAAAVRRAGKPALMGWAPTLHVYFPLAALACYKGLAELLFRPFYWDKTAHGIYVPGAAGAPGGRTTRPLPQPRHQDEGG